MSPMRLLLAIACANVLLSANCTRSADPSPLSHDAGPAPDAGAPPAPFLAEARVTKLSGVVEVRHPNSEEWTPLEQGAVLKKDDEVRTSGDGSEYVSKSIGFVFKLPGTIPFCTAGVLSAT